jgi:TolA-binding protein
MVMTEREKDPVEDLARSIRQIEARLPDTNRARGAQALVDRLRSEGIQKPSSTIRRGRAAAMGWAVAGVLAAAAILLGWVGLRSHPTPLTVGHESSVSLRPAVSTPASVLPDPRAILSLTPASPQTRARMTAEPGQDVRALLADCGRLVLGGPGEVAVEENSASEIVLRLARGNLYVSFDRDCSRRLEVRAADARVRVTGTVFAVHAHDGPTEVSVAQGRVLVETADRTIAVSAGKSWQVGSRGLATLPAAVAPALRELLGVKENLPTSPHHATRSVGVLERQPVRSEAARAPGTPPTTSTSSSEQLAAEVADAERLYRTAERSLSLGMPEKAAKQLGELVENHPTHGLAGPARYELGRLAFAARDFNTAGADFARVRASRQNEAVRFHEPAAFFLCRSEQELGKRATAIACFQQYRKEFPDSPHAADALAALTTLHMDMQDCGSALPLFREYIERFPHGSQIAAMRAAYGACKSRTP